MREKTVQLVEGEADRLWNRQDQNGRPLPLQLGDQKPLDAWGQPLEINITLGLLGDQVTVVSRGPDGEADTLDDLVAIRTNMNQGEAVANEAMNRLGKMLKKRIDGEAE